MLWEALTGSEIWKGSIDVAVMRRVLQGDVPPPHDVKPDVPQAIEAICMRAMATAREARYATAAEMEQALEAEAAKLSGHVKPRDLGAFVSELFADVRAETRALIEKELGGARSAANDAEAAPAGAKAAAPRSPAGGSSRVWLVAAVVVVCATALAIARALQPAPVAAPAPPPTATASAASALPAPPAWQAAAPAVPPPPAAASIEPPRRVLARGLAILLDDSPVRSNPFAQTFAADGSRHVVRAEARGYVAQERDLVFDRSEDLEITLVPAAAPGTARPRGSAGPGATQADCSHPYFIDARGIKSVKPECM